MNTLKLVKYAAAPILVAGAIVGALVLSAHFGGGLEAKLNTTRSACIGQAAKITVDVKGGRQFYHSEVRVTAPDGSIVYNGSLSRPDAGHFGVGFAVQQVGDYSVQATVRTPPKDRASLQMESVSVMGAFKAKYCT